jgi:hypothetical protein
MTEANSRSSAAQSKEPSRIHVLEGAAFEYEQPGGPRSSARRRGRRRRLSHRENGRDDRRADNSSLA